MLLLKSICSAPKGARVAKTFLDTIEYVFYKKQKNTKDQNTTCDDLSSRVKRVILGRKYMKDKSLIVFKNRGLNSFQRTKETQRKFSLRSTFFLFVNNQIANTARSFFSAALSCRLIKSVANSLSPALIFIASVQDKPPRL